MDKLNPNRIRQVFLALNFAICSSLFPADLFAQTREETIQRIYKEALTSSPAYENLRYLCKKIGNRISGSPQAAAAVEYTYRLMKQYGFDTVYLQPVMVSHWVRESKSIVRITNSPSKGNILLNSLAIGHSVGTGVNGITAQVIEVNGMEALKTMDKKLLKDKIVFFNKVFDPVFVNTDNGYDGVYEQRSGGASATAPHGALAVIVRSLAIDHSDYPHTGTLVYDTGVKKIPAVAISTNAADLLSAELKKEPHLKIYLEFRAQRFPDVLSYNVIGEIKGKKYPNEIIAVGGHLDSWDVGEGAHDDGGGCMQGIEVLRLFKTLGIVPDRTLRAVMWMDEESTNAGATEYAKQAKQKNEKHIAALESDIGAFTPKGFSFDTDKKRVWQVIDGWKKYFESYEVFLFNKGFSGSDVEPLKSDSTVVIGFKPDNQRYFSLHHTETDVFEAVNKRELELGAAAMATLVYLIALDGFR
ncbi:MAG: M20/M25/M40 family metallo-hydrolase [Chitinophagaceae bacterium]|nr:M20/M25/M40 family metallo-hydrolase [Chitinophagaceae bacterium]